MKKTVIEIIIPLEELGCRIINILNKYPIKNKIGAK